jgi:hypothetical protein
MVDVTNPFMVAYLSEGSYAPEELLARYSFEPIQYLHRKLASSNNVFLIGRPGVGKTMLLKIFDPDLVTLLYESEDPDRVRARSFLPEATVGIYLNLASPTVLTDLFQGRDRQNTWWFEAYSDFLSTFLFDQTLNAIERLFQVPKWRQSNHATTSMPLTNPIFVKELIRLLRRDSAQFEELDSVDGIRQLLHARLQEWSRFANSDAGIDPPKPIFGRLGRPLFSLVASMRKAAIFESPFRLFVIVDQYESLYDSREVIDFRPIFCEGMRAASRGSTGVEFKIGTRRYAYTNFYLPDGRSKIDLGREIIEIDLDAVADNFYHKLAADIFQKRMSPYFTSSPTALNPSRYLPSLTPIEETQLYTGDHSSEDRHILPFIERWKAYGLNATNCEGIVEDSGLRRANALVATLACVAITRWFRHGMKAAPLKCPEAPNGLNDVDRMKFYLSTLLQAIDERVITKPQGTKSTQRVRAIDYFVRDVTEAGLFQLASCYKNQRRYFTGFEAIVRLSSNVAVVLIELLQAVYEDTILSGKRVTVEVRPQLQSEAIYKVSSNWFNRITKEYDYGETHYEILSALGGALRRVQLELSAPQPCPNGFSVDSIDLDRDRLSTPNIGPRMDARSWLEEAVSRGLLEEEQHESKQRGKPKRRKYYVNRILCPYFGISAIWRKDPPYVHDLQKFVRTLREGNLPDEFANLLSRSETPHARVRQRSLLS